MTEPGPVSGHDDDRFLDEELLYRRIPKKPQFVVTPDAVTGKKRPTPAAFSIKNEPDGLSVSIDTLIRSNRLRTCHLCRDWSTHGVARFKLGLVRPALGVVAKEDPDDNLMGKAHGILSGPHGIPGPDVWNPIRDAIIHEADYFDSDPDAAS